MSGSRALFRALLTVFALAVTSSVALAHGGEDHGSPTAIAVGDQTGFAAEGAAFQVVLYPQPGKVVLYLAEADSNAPVVGAAIDAEAPGWQGQAIPAQQPGVYEIPWTVPEGGADISLLVSAGGNDDLILLPVTGQPPASAVTASGSDWRQMAVGALGIVVLAAGLIVVWRRRKAAAVMVLVLLGLMPFDDAAHAHGGEDHGAPTAVPSAPPPGAPVVMTKPVQFLLGIRTLKVEPRQAADTVRVLGRVIADPSGYARVQPSQPARVVADPAHPIPVPGQAVRRGQVLAVLEPTLSSLEKGDKRAGLSRVDSDIALTERDLSREESLGGLVPAKQLETTRIRLAQLRKERGQITGTALGREVLVAPVDGVVTDVHVVPGEVVTSDRVLVEIVDPARLRVEAVIHDLALAKRLSSATAASKMVPDQSFPLTLLGISPKLDPQDQGVHAVFQVAPGQAGQLNIGMPVDVYLASGATTLRMAVPRDAIAELGGRQVVFVRTAPETFDIRPVRVDRVIGPLADIGDGLKSGERVVIQGVDQLKAGR